MDDLSCHKTAEMVRLVAEVRCLPAYSAYLNRILIRRGVRVRSAGFAGVMKTVMRRGKDVVEGLNKLVRGCQPPTCTDLTRRGAHSRPLDPHYEVAWLRRGGGRS
jgi:hypothetical protein